MTLALQTESSLCVWHYQTPILAGHLPDAMRHSRSQELWQIVRLCVRICICI